MEQQEMAPTADDAVALHINPYTVAEQGWRGLSIPGNRKRKWYTVLHNDKVLVTALLTGIPASTSCGTRTRAASYPSTSMTRSIHR